MRTLKQLLPFRYDCHGYSNTDQQLFHVTWRMWFGRCFAVRWRWVTADGWQ